MRTRITGAQGRVNLAALGILLAASGCGEARGELVVVVQTDMEIPKDIDTIRITVSRSGRVEWENEFSRFGRSADAISLPATINVLQPKDNPAEPVTIRVSASQRGTWTIAREAVTPILSGRVSTLHMPLQFLCDGSARGLFAAPEPATSRCGEGMTCIAGECVPSEIEAESLPEYTEPDVFGGGSTSGDGVCFDVTGCFEDAIVAPLDEDCTVAAPEGGAVNVAILTERAGMCIGKRCFVALDAESPEGWRSVDGRIALPKAVCSATFAESRGVALSPVRAAEGCPRKTVAVPTCGPWSRVGAVKPGAGDGVPEVVAARQDHPVSLAVTALGRDLEAVFWASTGLFEPSDGSGGSEQRRSAQGSVKLAYASGGPITVLEQTDGSPRQITTFGNSVYWTTADDEGNGTIMTWTLESQEPTPTSLLPGVLKAPQGIAVDEGGSGGGEVIAYSLFGNPGRLFFRTEDGMTSSIDTGNHPYRMDAKAGTVCWTFEGTFGAGDGGVGCSKFNADVDYPGENQGTPRALAIEPTGAYVYWANFESGTIMKNRVDGGGATPVQSGLDHPNGVAVDNEYVYWTELGDGSVRRAPKDDTSGQPQRLATGQDAPGEIKVTDSYIYWVNEGSLYEPNGAVMRLKKPE